MDEEIAIIRRERISGVTRILIVDRVNEDCIAGGQAQRLILGDKGEAYSKILLV